MLGEIGSRVPYDGVRQGGHGREAVYFPDWGGGKSAEDIWEWSHGRSAHDIPKDACIFLSWITGDLVELPIAE